MSAEEWSQPLITLPVPLKLKAVPYRFTVWADYTRGASLPDTYYNTENFRSVSHTLPYEEDYLRREAFFGNASADLAGEEWRDGIQITVKRPLAFGCRYGATAQFRSGLQLYPQHKSL